MDHGLMSGMLWAGVLLSSIPIALGLGIGAYVLQRYRTARAPDRGDPVGERAARR